MFVYTNPNPQNKRVGDCTVRAISIVTNQDWEKTYIELCVKGLTMHDMPSANDVWGAYLYDKGFRRLPMPNFCPNCYTVSDFCRDYPDGTYLLALYSHVVAVMDGNYYDVWDSGDETALYVWKQKEG